MPIQDELGGLAERAKTCSFACGELLHKSRALRRYLIRKYACRCRGAMSEDLEQDVLTEMLSSIGTFDSRRGAFSTWFGTIVRRTACLRHKRECARLWLSIDGEQELPSRAMGPFDAAVLSQVLAHLACTLPEQQMVAYLSGESSEQIGERFDISAATARQRWCRALRAAKVWAEAARDE